MKEKRASMSTCPTALPSIAAARVLLGALPGALLVMLHYAMLALPRADIIDALDSDHYRIQWIMGSYLLGGAVGLGLTRYVAGRFGLRHTLVGAVLLFGGAATVCGLQSEVISMAPWRLLQGVGAGLTLSGSMAVLFRAFAERRPTAMAVYGSGVFLAALSGAVLAGLITYAFSWRGIFLLNLPFAPLAAWLAWRELPADRPAPAARVRFDWLGFGLFLATVATLIIVLDTGQYWGWLTSPFFVPWLAAFVFFAVAFALRGLLAAEPFIDLRLFGLRNFALGIILKAIFSSNLYALLVLLSLYMINLRHYQWWQGALVLLPAAVAFAVTQGLAEKERGGRARMLVGFAVMAMATGLLANVDLYTDKRWLAAFLGLWGAGAGLAIVPVMRTIFDGLTDVQTLHCAGIYNMMRMLPEYIALSLLATLLVQGSDVQFNRLRQDITYNRPQVERTNAHLDRHFSERGSSRAVSQQQARALLGRWVHVNARAYAFQQVLAYLALATAGAVLVICVVARPARG